MSCFETAYTTSAPIYSLKHREKNELLQAQNNLQNNNCRRSFLQQKIQKHCYYSGVSKQCQSFTITLKIDFPKMHKTTIQSFANGWILAKQNVQGHCRFHRPLSKLSNFESRVGNNAFDHWPLNSSLRLNPIFSPLFLQNPMSLSTLHHPLATLQLVTVICQPHLKGQNRLHLPTQCFRNLENLKYLLQVVLNVRELQLQRRNGRLDVWSWNWPCRNSETRHII